MIIYQGVYLTPYSRVRADAECIHVSVLVHYQLHIQGSIHGHRVNQDQDCPAMLPIQCLSSDSCSGLMLMCDIAPFRHADTTSIQGTYCY